MKVEIKNNYPDVVANDLIEYFAANADKLNQPTRYTYDVFCALKVAETTRDNLPMYTGELNPKWKFWNDVVSEITKQQ
jgi:hypothetical protein|tara:strand:+ start:267 stop:500 length:234 start_codon:yes stop_codon:yes gene_type:complete